MKQNSDRAARRPLRRGMNFVSSAAQRGPSGRLHGFAERLRLAVSNLDWTTVSPDIHVTASLGVACGPAAKAWHALFMTAGPGRLLAAAAGPGARSSSPLPPRSWRKAYLWYQYSPAIALVVLIPKMDGRSVLANLPKLVKRVGEPVQGLGAGAVEVAKLINRPPLESLLVQ